MHNLDALRDELHATQQFLTGVLASIVDPILVVDNEGRVTAVNEALLCILDYAAEQDVIDLPLRRLLMVPESVGTGERLAEWLLQATTAHTFFARDGSQRPVAMRTTPIVDGRGVVQAIICTVLHVVERSMAEVALRQVECMAALRRLGCGLVAHIGEPLSTLGDGMYALRQAHAEISILLRSYRTFAQAAADGRSLEALGAEIHRLERELEQTHSDARLVATLESSIEGIARVRSILRALEVFAAPGTAEQAPVDLNVAIISTLTVARHEYQHVAELETRLEALPPVVCAVGEVTQALLHLIANAAHAIAEVVATDHGEKGRLQVCSHMDGPWAVVTVRDSGRGIPEAIRGRLFEPFFTTKASGRGSGQGLSIAYANVVERHGGSLTFESVPGRGTTFRMRLPIAGSRGPAGSPERMVL